MSTTRKPHLNRYRWGAMGLRTLAHLLHHWPWLLLAAAFLSPISPHMLWQYDYIQHPGGNKLMIRCRYLGPHGFRPYKRGFDCPYFVLIDSRDE